MRMLVTFGQEHAHRINNQTLDKDSVAVINCDNYDHGRKLAFEFFDNKFHNTYEEGKEPSNLMFWFPRGKIEVN